MAEPVSLGSAYDFRLFPLVGKDSSRQIFNLSNKHKMEDMHNHLKVKILVQRLFFISFHFACLLFVSHVSSYFYRVQCTLLFLAEIIVILRRKNIENERRVTLPLKKTE